MSPLGLKLNKGSLLASMCKTNVRKENLMLSKKLALLLLFVFLFANSSIAKPKAKTPYRRLPPPRTKGGRPLLDVLSSRKTTREFSERTLTNQLLSDLLWAAAGVNRPKVGKRTAPSAMNQQAIDIYLARKDGLWFYMPKRNMLRLVQEVDLRKETGEQDFVGSAPLNIVYVADSDRMKTDANLRSFYAAADTSFMVQNVYLFCASEGLATVVRGWVNRKKLAKKMGLRRTQRVTLCQTVGYAKKEGAK